MANKPITSATAVTALATTDKIFVNQGSDLKQITVSDFFNSANVMTDTEFNTLWAEITA